MKFIIHAATKMKFRTDGKRVDRWSSNHRVWFPDGNVTPDIIENMIKTGNAYPLLPSKLHA